MQTHRNLMELCEMFCESFLFVVVRTFRRCSSNSRCRHCHRCRNNLLFIFHHVLNKVTPKQCRVMNANECVSRVLSLHVFLCVFLFSLSICFCVCVRFISFVVSLFFDLIDFHEFIDKSMSWNCHTFTIKMPYAYK